MGIAPAAYQRQLLSQAARMRYQKPAHLLAALLLMACTASAAANDKPEGELGHAFPMSSQEAAAYQRETADLYNLPVSKTIDLGDDVAMEFVLVPPGWFMMGRNEFPATTPAGATRRSFTAAELPRRRVIITKPFYIGRYEVTQRQWRALVGGANPSKHYKRDEEETRPVDSIQWHEVTEGAMPRLQARLPDGWKAQLPTEAQWEYACRAGTETPYSFGDQISSDLVNTIFKDETTGRLPKPVGSYPPNAWGIFDMHGNMWEYCADIYDPDFYARAPEVDPFNETRPKQFAESKGHVIRGGSAGYPAFYCRSAHRGIASEAADSDRRFPQRGVRMVIVPQTTAAPQ